MSLTSNGQFLSLLSSPHASVTHIALILTLYIIPVEGGTSDCGGGEEAILGLKSDSRSPLECVNIERT